MQVSQKMTKIECEQCDLDNALKVGRAHWVCPVCGKDVSLVIFLLDELSIYFPDKNRYINKAKDENFS